MMKLICWFLGHHWTLTLKDVGSKAEVGYYECQRCGERENYFF